MEDPHGATLDLSAISFFFFKLYDSTWTLSLFRLSKLSLSFLFKFVPSLSIAACTRPGPEALQICYPPNRAIDEQFESETRRKEKIWKLIGFRFNGNLMASCLQSKKWKSNEFIVQSKFQMYFNIIILIAVKVGMPNFLILF